MTSDELAGARKWFVEGWGKHYTRWVLLVLLAEAGDEGISYPDGIPEALKNADPVDLRERFRKTYEAGPGSTMDQEFDVWLLMANRCYGTKLHPDVQNEVEALRGEDDDA
jgi:hypothetical protein